MCYYSLTQKHICSIAQAGARDQVDHIRTGGTGQCRRFAVPVEQSVRTSSQRCAVINEFADRRAGGGRRHIENEKGQNQFRTRAMAAGFAQHGRDGRRRIDPDTSAGID